MRVVWDAITERMAKQSISNLKRKIEMAKFKLSATEFFVGARPLQILAMQAYKRCHSALLLQIYSEVKGRDWRTGPTLHCSEWLIDDMDNSFS